jgi:hypothetical protein
LNTPLVRSSQLLARGYGFWLVHFNFISTRIHIDMVYNSLFPGTRILLQNDIQYMTHSMLASLWASEAALSRLVSKKANDKTHPVSKTNFNSLSVHLLGHSVKPLLLHSRHSSCSDGPLMTSHYSRAPSEPKLRLRNLPNPTKFPKSN